MLFVEEEEEEGEEGDLAQNDEDVKYLERGEKEKLQLLLLWLCLLGKAPTRSNTQHRMIRMKILAILLFGNSNEDDDSADLEKYKEAEDMIIFLFYIYIS